MRSFSRAGLAALLMIVLATGCGGKKPRAERPPEYGPQPPSPSAAPAVPEAHVDEPLADADPDAPLGPLPAPDFVPPKDGLVLVLGPGLARALAYIGVLHELERRQVPIRALVGVEMGALIGGIWASSNLNNLEWEMHKFRRQTLLDTPILGIGAKVAEGKRLYGFLERALKVRLLQKMKVPLIVASAARDGGGVLFDTAGSAKDAIRGAMGIPGVIRPYAWEGHERVTAALESPFPADRARELGLGQVVCVDVIGRGDNTTDAGPAEEQLAALMRSVATTARAQLRACDVVLSIPTDGIGYFEFDAKADLIYRGKMTVQNWLEGER